jgi:isocitrate dehydrogenase
MASTITYTLTDESPVLATHSLLPIIESFVSQAGLNLETKDISLAGRILAQFPEWLSDAQKQSDALAELGSYVKQPEANIIKLPNISASTPQLKEAIKELQRQGFPIPDYPVDPRSDKEKDIQARYAKVLGSAVNPVLREGNSDRRVAQAVKQYAQNNPHKLGEWSQDSKTHVAHMEENDFFGSEQSVIMPEQDKVTIRFRSEKNRTQTLKENIALEKNEIIDSAVMNQKSLRSFFDRQIQEAKSQGVLLSLHLKATMMKVSDPIIFGHAVKAYYRSVFDKHHKTFEKLGINPNYGMGDVYNKIQTLSEAKRQEIEKDIEAAYHNNPDLAMVDSHKGITNLDVPNNVIIDASMPAAIKSSGKMWGPDDQLHDTKAMIPDRCYARIYQEVIAVVVAVSLQEFFDHSAGPARPSPGPSEIPRLLLVYLPEDGM